MASSFEQASSTDTQVAPAVSTGEAGYITKDELFGLVLDAQENDRVPQISPEQFHYIINHMNYFEGVTIHDVRSPEEFAENHIEGIPNTPFNINKATDEEVEEAENFFRNTGDIKVLMCQSGARSTGAADLIGGEGCYLVSVRGGLNALEEWRKGRAQESQADRYSN